MSASTEQVSHPAHYGDETNPYETIKVLEEWLTPEQFEGFLLGNSIKYQSRYRQKGGVQDLEKSAWYQARLVEFAKRRDASENVAKLRSDGDHAKDSGSRRGPSDDDLGDEHHGVQAQGRTAPRGHALGGDAALHPGGVQHAPGVSPATRRRAGRSRSPG